MSDSKIYKYKDKIIIAFVILIASFGLFGWTAGKLFFAQISIFYIPIAPSTALSFLIISIALWLLLQYTDNKSIVIICHFSLLMIIAFSGIIIFEWMFKPTWDIENIFIKNPAKFGKVVIGRMSPLTATLFILESFAILIYNSISRKTLKNIYGGIVFVAFFTSSILLIGYLYNTPLLYGGNTVPVALPTAVCFWLTSIALLIVINFNFWPFSLLIGNSTERQLTRTFFPVILFLLILNSYLNSNILVNYQNPALISALVLIMAINLFGFVIVFISKNLGKSLAKAQQTIIETEYRFSKAITHAPFPIMIHSNGEVIQLSNAWTELTGYTIEDIPTIVEWTKKAYGENAIPSQEYINKLYEIESVKYDGEWEIKISDGSTRIWEFMTSPIGKLQNGRKVVSSMAVDITKRLQDEKALKETNKSLQDMVYIASHDLQVPLISMEGYATELLENNKDKLDEDGVYCLTRLQANAQRMHKLVLSLLDISRLNTLKNPYEEFSLKIIIDKILKDISLTVEKANSSVLYGELPKLYADKQRIEGVFRNLILNSLNYGGININIGFEHNILFIKDDGIGIPTDQLERVFKPGERLKLTKAEGIGMGLTFCKKVIEQHNGKIWAESEGENKGTTIYIEFNKAVFSKQ